MGLQITKWPLGHKNSLTWPKNVKGAKKHFAQAGDRPAVALVIKSSKMLIYEQITYKFNSVRMFIF